MKWDHSGFVVLSGILVQQHHEALGHLVHPAAPLAVQLELVPGSDRGIRTVFQELSCMSTSQRSMVQLQFCVAAFWLQKQDWSASASSKGVNLAFIKSATTHVSQCLNS